VQFSPDVQEYLILVRKEQGASTLSSYGIIAIDRSNGTTFAGAVQFYNLSDFRIACRLNSDDFVLERGGEIVVSPDSAGEVSLGLRVAKQVEEAWEVGFNSVWSHHSDLSTIIIILNHPRREGAILARRLYDEQSGAGEAEPDEPPAP
jgi:hypothetical protein